MNGQRIIKYSLIESLSNWLGEVGVANNLIQSISVGMAIAIICIIAFIANLITRLILIEAIREVFKRIKLNWTNFFIKRKVLDYLAHIIPAIIIHFAVIITFSAYSNNLIDIISKLTDVYIAWTIMWVILALLDVFHDIYITTASAKNHPIKGYIQLGKILIYLLSVVIMISILMDNNPINLLVGMSASAAILMLVFKDTILGLVASVQVSANDMVKPGDWIEMPSRNVDGIVLELSLNTVKVQNWNLTISTIPTYALVSESFTNWKGMEESSGRRIKRSIYIDMHSVKFCSDDLLNKLRKVHYLKDYIDTRSKEIEEFNYKNAFDTSTPINGRRMTNLGVFRKYLEEYLNHNPNVNKEPMLLVRQMQPTENGIPLEIYCFSKEKGLFMYENVQADIFDHIFAIVPEFELTIFQAPSGADFRHLIK